MEDTPSISIRIFGVPERIDMIRKNQELLQLPDSHIFLDEEHKGCLWNARRAWSHPTSREFTLVLSDDVELCKNFTHYINIITRVQPDSVISLYSNQFNKRLRINRIPDAPYVSTHLVAGPGIILRTEWVEPCLNSWQESNPCDDGNIANWANSHEIQILTTLPVIIQHIGEESIFDPSRNLGRSELYNDNPIDVNWENSFVNTASNVVRR